MYIKIAGIEPESIVDGEGIRFVVFTQGCLHHCNGCQNPQTWDFGSGRFMRTEDIIQQFKEKVLIDGITLSGGEPFMQPDACLKLARAAKKAGLTVWCYTGYTLETIRASNLYAEKELLRNIDVLVDGPFVEEKKSLDLQFRGSSNQRIIHLDHGRVVSIEGGDE